MRYSLDFWALVVYYKGYCARQFEMYGVEKRAHFVNFNIDYKISLLSRAVLLRYVVGQNQGHSVVLPGLKK